MLTFSLWGSIFHALTIMNIFAIKNNLNLILKEQDQSKYMKNKAIFSKICKK